MQDKLDFFAAHAMVALISKMPFIDAEGEIGKQLPTKEMQDIKSGIAKSAYEYAEYMVIAREESKAWMEENKSFFNN